MYTFRYAEPEPIEHPDSYDDPYYGHQLDSFHDARINDGFDGYETGRGECLNLSRDKLAVLRLSLPRSIYRHVNKS